MNWCIATTGIFPGGGAGYFDITTVGPPGIGRNSFRGPKYSAVDFSFVKSTGLPSITIPLWDENHPNTKIGTMRFLYGRIRSADGTNRYGWMAEDALEVSSGCP